MLLNFKVFVFGRRDVYLPKNLKEMVNSLKKNFNFWSWKKLIQINLIQVPHCEYVQIDFKAQTGSD